MRMNSVIDRSIRYIPAGLPFEGNRRSDFRLYEGEEGYLVWWYATMWV